MKVGTCDEPAKVTVALATKLAPFIVSVCEPEPTGVVEGERLAMLGTGLDEGGGGVELPPPQPQAKLITTIRKINHVRVGFQPNRICGWGLDGAKYSRESR
jgi:hypothetical protein